MYLKCYHQTCSQMIHDQWDSSHSSFVHIRQWKPSKYFTLTVHLISDQHVSRVTGQRKGFPPHPPSPACLKLSKHLGSIPTPLLGLLCRRHLPLYHLMVEDRREYSTGYSWCSIELSCVYFFGLFSAAPFPLLGIRWISIWKWGDDSVLLMWQC